MDDILPQYRSPRDTPLSLGLCFFYPTLSNGITLYQFSSGGSGDSAAAGSAVCSAAYPFL